jgi:hypothetical protein
VKQRSGGNSVSIHGGTTFIGNIRGGNVVISVDGIHISGGGGRVVVNGVDVTAAVKQGGDGEVGNLSGIEVKGSCGNDVEINSTESVNIQAMGNNGRIKSGGNLSAKSVGDDCKVNADGSICSQTRQHIRP